MYDASNKGRFSVKIPPHQLSRMQTDYSQRSGPRTPPLGPQQPPATAKPTSPRRTTTMYRPAVNTQMFPSKIPAGMSSTVASVTGNVSANYSGQPVIKVPHKAQQTYVPTIIPTVVPPTVVPPAAVPLRSRSKSPSVTTPARRKTENATNMNTVPGCITIQNINEGKTVGNKQIQSRLKETLKQDISIMFRIKPQQVKITSLGGSPLAVCFSLLDFESHVDKAEIIRRGQLTISTGTVLLPITCKLYSQLTGVFTPQADIIYSKSWLLVEPSTIQDMGIGHRVVRNELFWKWGEQDGGIGNPGTVIDCHLEECWVVVKWDATGEANKYRWGNGVYDIQVSHLDNSPSPLRSRTPDYQSDQQIAKGISVGCRVKRNPHNWLDLYGSPDGGDGGLGTVKSLTAMTGWSSDALPATSNGYWLTVLWDHNPSDTQLYRWGINGKHDVTVVYDPSTQFDITSNPTQPQPVKQEDSVRCLQVTLLSAKGLPPVNKTRIQISFEGGAPEYTSTWVGPNPAWGETVVLDVPPGISHDLVGKHLRVVLLSVEGESLAPIGGCELEMGHLVNPVTQTLWVALDGTMRSKLIASPKSSARSFQTDVTTPTSWLRLSVGFVFSQLQKRVSAAKNNPVQYELPAPVQYELPAPPLSPPTLANVALVQEDPHFRRVSPPRHANVASVQEDLHFRNANVASQEDLHFRNANVASQEDLHFRRVSPPRGRSTPVTTMTVSDKVRKLEEIPAPPVSYQRQPEPIVRETIETTTEISSVFESRKPLVTPLRAKKAIPQPPPSIPQPQPVQQLAPPVQQLAPQQLAPPIQQLALPIQQLAPPIQQLAQPIQQLAPPSMEVSSQSIPVEEVRSKKETSPQAPVPAEGQNTTVVEYLVQLAFDPVTVLELAKALKKERIEDVSTLILLSESDLQNIGIPLGCRKKIYSAIRSLQGRQF